MATSIPEALTEQVPESKRDPRALRILAKTIYRELRSSGLREEEVVTIAGELLSLVTGDLKDRRSATIR